MKKQRTKGGVKPSSSEKAANALQQLGSAGFVTFETLADDDTSLPEQKLSNSSNKLDEDEDSSAARKGAFGSTDDDVEAEVNAILKKLTKKDASTRCRALRELAETFNGDRAVNYATVSTRLFIAKQYQRCAVDENIQIRELANNLFKRVGEALDEAGKRNLSAFLRSGLPSLLLSSHDEVSSVASAAQSAFAVLFDSPSRRMKAVFAVRDAIAELVESTLLEYGELRSTHDRDNDNKQQPPEGDFWQQRVASAFRLLSTTVNQVLAFYSASSKENYEQVGGCYVELLEKETDSVCNEAQKAVAVERSELARFLDHTCFRMLIRNDRFWKALNANDKQSESNIRCATFSCARSLVYASRILFSDHFSTLPSQETTSETAETESDSVIRRVTNAALRCVNSAELRVAYEAEKTLQTLIRLEKAATQRGTNEAKLFWPLIDAAHFALPQLSSALNALSKGNTSASSLSPTVISHRIAIIIAVVRSLLRYHRFAKGEKGVVNESLVRFITDAWSRVLDVAKQPRVAVSDEDFDRVCRKLCSLTCALLEPDSVIAQKDVTNWLIDRFIGELLLSSGRPLIRKRSWQLTVQRVAILLRGIDSALVSEGLTRLCSVTWPVQSQSQSPSDSDQNYKLCEPLDRFLLLLATLCGVPCCVNPKESPRTTVSLTELRFEPFLELVTNQPDLLSEFELESNADDNVSRTLISPYQNNVINEPLKRLVKLFIDDKPMDDASATRYCVLTHLVAITKVDSSENVTSRFFDYVAAYFRESTSAVIDADTCYVFASLTVLLHEIQPNSRPQLVQQLLPSYPNSARVEWLLSILEQFPESSLAKTVWQHESIDKALRSSVERMTGAGSESEPDRVYRHLLHRCLALLCARKELSSLRSELFESILESARKSLGLVANGNEEAIESTRRSALQRCGALFEPLFFLVIEAQKPCLFQTLVEYLFYCRLFGVASSVTRQLELEFLLPALMEFAGQNVPLFAEIHSNGIHNCKSTKQRVDSLVELFSESVGKLGSDATGVETEGLVTQLMNITREVDSNCVTLLAFYVDLAFVAHSRPSSLFSFPTSGDDTLSHLARSLFSVLRRCDVSLCGSFESEAVTKLKATLVGAYFVARCYAALACAMATRASDETDVFLQLIDRLFSVDLAGRLILQLGSIECVAMSELYATSACFRFDQSLPPIIELVKRLNQPFLASFAANSSNNEPCATFRRFSSAALLRQINVETSNEPCEQPFSSVLLQTANRLESLLGDIRSQSAAAAATVASNDATTSSLMPARFRFPENTMMPDSLVELMDSTTLLLTSMRDVSPLDSDCLRSIKRLLDAVCSVKPYSVSADLVGYHAVMRFVLAALRSFETLSKLTGDGSDQEQVMVSGHFDYCVCRISDTFDWLTDRSLSRLPILRHALLNAAATALRVYYCDVLDESSVSQRSLLNELRAEFSAVFEMEMFKKLSGLFIARCLEHDDNQHQNETFAAGLCRSICSAISVSPKQPLLAVLNDAQSLLTILVEQGIQSDCVYVCLASSDLLGKHDIDVGTQPADTDADAEMGEESKLPNWLTSALEVAERHLFDALQLVALPPISETTWESLEVEVSDELAAAALRYLLVIRLTIRTFESAAIQVRSRYAAQLTEKDSASATCMLDKLVRSLFSLMPKAAQMNRVTQLQQLRLDQPSRANLLRLAGECFSIPDTTAAVRWMTLVSALALGTYSRLLSAMPALVRDWRDALDRRAQSHVDRLTAAHVSPSLIRAEMRSLSDAHANDAHGELRVQTSVKTREVFAKYAVAGGELTLELTFKLPENYPIGFIDVPSETRRTGVPLAKWRKWMMQLSSFLQQRNSSLYECLLIWKRNVDNSFDGVDDCMICYSVIHAGTYQTPQKQCTRCKKRFHAACLYRWFTTSQNATCPLCRELF